MALAKTQKWTVVGVMIAESFITSLKLLEEATLFAVERITGYLSMSCEVDRRYYLISVISSKNVYMMLLKPAILIKSEELYPKSYISSLIDEMHMSIPVGEKSPVFPVLFCVLFFIFYFFAGGGSMMFL